MQHIVVDLEFAPIMDKKERNGLNREIIEIGAVRLDENYEFVDSFDAYVRPEYAFVTKKIFNLTGIAKAKLLESPKFDEAMGAFTDWIGKEKFKIYQWSRCDRSQIVKECQVKCLEDKYGILCQKHWIDIQKLYSRVFKAYRQPSLNSALEYLYIEPEGQMHRACDDAKNTSLILQTMAIKEKFRETTEPMKNIVNKSSCMATLGDIFGTELNSILGACEM